MNDDDSDEISTSDQCCHASYSTWRVWMVTLDLRNSREI